MNTPAPSFIKKGWQGFAIRKFKNTVETINYIDYETRNSSTISLIKDGVAKNNTSDFGWILINTSDRDDFSWLSRRKVDHSTIIDDNGNIFNYISCCHSGSHIHNGKLFSSGPDFVYDHWKQTGLNNYEETRIKMKGLGKSKTNLLGWRGANTHKNRKNLVALNDKLKFDCEFVTWDRSNPEKLTATNFLSFEEQVSNWRFLIDIEGNGYSGRLKLLLNCPRAVFIQERKYREDFQESLVPWRHFIPVKNDFSDLEKNLNILLKSPNLEKSIIAEANLFADTFLTREAAERRWANIFEYYSLMQNEICTSRFSRKYFTRNFLRRFFNHGKISFPISKRAQ